jgi:hypothetical protein
LLANVERTAAMPSRSFGGEFPHVRSGPGEGQASIQGLRRLAMKWSIMAMSSILISASWAGFHPAMAQQWRHEQERAGQMHPANGGMHPMHLQQQMQQQAQHERQMYEQHMRQMQQHSQQQYENDAKEFNQYLKANGGGTGKLPKNPQEFEAWSNKQKTAKAQGKSYDPMYDHYVNFAVSKGWMKSEGGHSRSGQSQSAAQGKGQEKRAEARSEERRDGEREREERRDAEQRERRNAEEARREKDRQAARKRAMVADGTSISMLKTVLGNLHKTDADYNGQREHAMHSVSQALHHLGVSAPATIGSIGGNMAQTQSDGIMRDAIRHLRTVETRLGGPAFNAPQHAEARASVSQAIHHLEAALHVR